MLSSMYLACKTMGNKFTAGLKQVLVKDRSQYRRSEVHYSMLLPGSSSNSSPVNDTSSEDASDEDDQAAVIDDDSAIFVCEICFEVKRVKDLFRVKGCVHYYCSDCVTLYVESKLSENVLHIKCPEQKCDGVLDPEHCKPILPVEDFDRWGLLLCESLIVEKLYCPYYDCSALLACDCREGKIGGQSECPCCKRLFCARCKVPWHAGTDCRKFQKMIKHKRGREDAMVKQLAKRKRWKRCPSCKFYVEKSSGCMHMVCRCGFNFCYECGGSPRSIVHQLCVAKLFCYYLCRCFR